MKHSSRSSSPLRQRGIASLIIVAILFFILSLAAAYTNRNLIFEQRTSANQYRSTQALEAAEAGVEWALSMLNSGRIDTASCAASTDVAQTTFRQRYLAFNTSTGIIQPTTLDADLAGTVWSSCVFDGSSWNCSCPATGAPSLTAPSGTSVFPAFRVRFRLHQPLRAGVVWLEVNGCTRLDDVCLDFPAQAVAGDSRAFVRVLVALKSGLPSPPTAALTVRGNLNAAGSTLGVFNPSPGGAGLAILTGGALSGEAAGPVRLGGAPGQPAEQASLVRTGDVPLNLDGLADDAERAERMFSNTFLATLETYRDQPGTVLMNCSATCNADQVRDMAALNPGRVLWADGDVNLGPGADIGSATNPVILVVDGSATIDLTLHGVIYGVAEDWNVDGANTGVVRGALIAGNDLTADPALAASVVRDADVLTQLRWRSGSFVRVPGGWRDF